MVLGKLKVIFAVTLFFEVKETTSFVLRWDNLAENLSHREGNFLERRSESLDVSPPTFTDERDGLGMGEKIKEIGHLFTMHGPPWYVDRAFGNPAYFHMHIPKAAGYSVIASSRDFLPKGTGLFSSEICYKDLRKLNTIYKGNGIMTLVRKPSDHVYSQYWECAADDHFQNRIKNTQKKHFVNFTVWLNHFTEHASSEDFGCYHPHNMQTRYFDCSFISCSMHRGCHMNGHGALQPHDARSSDTNLEEAVRNMDSMFFVGLVEQYQVSMCIFVAKVTNELPKWCNCEDKEAWASFPNNHDDHRHNVPRHSVDDITEEEHLMINALTKHDAILYEKSQVRFAKDVEEVEKAKGVKIICPA